MKKIFILSNDNPNLSNVKKGLMAALKSLELDKPMKVEITPHKEDKSSQQRAWFHILCQLLASELGYSPDDIKQYCKEEAFGVHTVTISGKSKEVVMPSESAKKDEYSHLVETVYMLSAQAGVTLPQPKRK